MGKTNRFNPLVLCVTLEEHFTAAEQGRFVATIIYYNVCINNKFPAGSCLRQLHPKWSLTLLN